MASKARIPTEVARLELRSRPRSARMKTHVRTVLLLTALSTTAGMAAAAGWPFPYRGEALAHYARISLMTARQLAQRVRPGIIISQGLEREAGGSGLRYSFDIKSGPRVYEVGIDARNGRVLQDNVAEPSAD
jgi:hypothetical protein